MKVIIAGSRTIHSYTLVIHAMDRAPFGCSEYPPIDEIVCGMCPDGVDFLATVWAKEYRKKLTPFFADWTKYGPKAGPIRNRKMAEYADGLVAVWDGRSRGTKNMIEEMEKLSKPIFIYP